MLAHIAVVVAVYDFYGPSPTALLSRKHEVLVTRVGIGNVQDARWVERNRSILPDVVQPIHCLCDPGGICLLRAVDQISSAVGVVANVSRVGCVEGERAMVASGSLVVRDLQVHLSASVVVEHLPRWAARGAAHEVASLVRVSAHEVAHAEYAARNSVGRRRTRGARGAARIDVYIGDASDPTEVESGGADAFMCEGIAILILARALAGKPRFLLADEPTGNLDSEMAGQVLELLETINSHGTTIIMVTHDPALAARAHRNIHILDGRASDLGAATRNLHLAASNGRETAHV